MVLPIGRFSLPDLSKTHAALYLLDEDSDLMSFRHEGPFSP